VPNPKQVSEFQAHKNGKATTAKIQLGLRHCGNKQQSNAGASSIHPSMLSKTVERSGKRKAGTKDLGEFMKNVSMASQFLSDRGS
jgi:isocitrate dehydrogenase